MDRLDVVQQRNRFIMFTLWPLLVLGTLVTFFITPVYSYAIAGVGIPFLVMVTFLILKRKMPYATMYIVVFAFSLIIFLMNMMRPSISAFCMVFLALVIISLYQDIRPLLLMGALVVIMAAYFYIAFGVNMLPQAGLDDIFFMNVFVIFILLILIAQIQFSEKIRINLEKIISQIREFSVKLKENVDMTGQISREVTASFQEIASSVESQTESVSDIKNSIISIGESVQSVVRDSASMSRLSEETDTEIEKGNRQIEVLTRQIDSIHSIISKNTSLIEELSGKTRLINQILGKLDDIVERTDLLALNAAIESARAGEYGLGFAVVSEEVRKLSESSRVSMKDIANILQDIRSRSEEIAGLFIEGKSAVDAGKNAMEGVENVFRQVTDHAKLMLQKSGQVEGMVHKLEESSGVIVREIASIADISEGISESVGGVFANVEDQSQRVNGIVDSFAELEKMTSGLKGSGQGEQAD
ncbi:MAG: methyl-accepting chemotaxis protein [Bacillota bacterium]